jgi:hypothetical protein
MHGTNPEEAASASSIKRDEEAKRKTYSTASYGGILRETIWDRLIASEPALTCGEK